MGAPVLCPLGIPEHESERKRKEPGKNFTRQVGSCLFKVRKGPFKVGAHVHRMPFDEPFQLLLVVAAENNHTGELGLSVSDQVINFR